MDRTFQKNKIIGTFPGIDQHRISYRQVAFYFKEKFKNDISRLAQVETTAPQIVNRGFVGPLGGYSGTAVQVEFLSGKNLKIIGDIRHLPKY